MSVKLMNFKKYYLEKKELQVSVVPEFKRFRRLTETRRFGEDGPRRKPQAALSDPRRLPLPEPSAQPDGSVRDAAGPASVCATRPPRQPPGTPGRAASRGRCRNELRGCRERHAVLRGWRRARCFAPRCGFDGPRCGRRCRKASFPRAVLVACILSVVS